MSNRSSRRRRVARRSRRAPHVAARIAFDDLHAQLSLYLKQSGEMLYQRDFGWIDQVKEVRDASTEADLNSAFIRLLKSKKRLQCWMAPDGIIDWNQVAWFQFGMASSASRLTQLTLDRLIDYLGGVQKISLKGIARCRVYALRADDSIAHEWPALRCLQSEMQWQGNTYILNAGKWYEIDQRFVTSVNRLVSAIPVLDLDLPEYEDDNEGKYNKRAALVSKSKFAVMDANNISHGGGQSRIEFCDLFSASKEMVHVKRYSGSSVLSHLFSQAAVAGQLFRADADFRKKVDAKLPGSHKIGDYDAAPKTDEYALVIAIVGGPASCVELPFFSRVTLRNTNRLLTALGYRVGVSHEPLEAKYAVLESLREKKKREKNSLRRKGVGKALPRGRTRSQRAPLSS